MPAVLPTVLTLITALALVFVPPGAEHPSAGRPVGPEPEKKLPSPDQVARWRGSLSLNDRWGTWAYAGWDDGRRAEFRRVYREAGYTHVALNFALDYHAADVKFDFRSDPETFAQRLQELLGDGLIPVLSLAQAETYGRFGPAEPIVSDLRRLLPIWRPHLPGVFTGWEHTDFLTPDAHKAIVEVARELLPEAWIGVEFSRKNGEQPMWYDTRNKVAADARDYYTRWLSGRVNGVLVNMPLDVLEEGDRVRFFDHLAGLVARATGPFEIPSTFPWGDPVPEKMRRNWRSPYALGLDVIYFEGPAYLRWPEEKKREWGALAMQVPRLAGYGDGGPPVR